MATSAYLTGRRRYSRPQGILWSNNAGTLSNGLYVPNGIEVGADTEETDPNLLDQFIILSVSSINHILPKSLVEFEECFLFWFGFDKS